MKETKEREKKGTRGIMSDRTAVRRGTIPGDNEFTPYEELPDVTVHPQIYSYYGLDNPWVSPQMIEYMNKIAVTSREGMEGDLFRTIGSSQASAIARESALKGIGAVESETAGYGGVLSSGRVSEIRSESASGRVASFGQLIQNLASRDEEIRANAKKILMDLLLKKEQMYMDLKLTDKSIAAQLS